MSRGVGDGVGTAKSGSAASGYNRQVPAVGQAVDVLYYLAAVPSGEANLTQICRAVDIHLSKGHAILGTLRSTGLVVRSQAKMYTLGPGALTLSRSVLDRTGLATAADPYLRDLSALTGATALLGLITADHVFIVARREAPATLGVTIRVGHRYPLTWGAHGKAIVAFLSPERRGEILAGGPLLFRGDPVDHPVDVTGLEAELDETRLRGFAVDLGGMQAGVSAVSVPLMNSHGDPAAVLILVGTFSADLVADRGQSVVRAAQEMRVRLAPFLEDNS